MSTAHRYDHRRQFLNRIRTWTLFGHLSTLHPVSERQRISLFNQTLRSFSRRIHFPVRELRWVLKEEGNGADKLHHLHFLLDGSNLPKKSPESLARGFLKCWKAVGGGNAKVEPYSVETDVEGCQKAVSYICKKERYPGRYSSFFDGDDCRMKFSPALDDHIASLSRRDEDRVRSGESWEVAKAKFIRLVGQNSDPKKQEVAA